MVLLGVLAAGVVVSPMQTIETSLREAEKRVEAGPDTCQDGTAE